MDMKHISFHIKNYAKTADGRYKTASITNIGGDYAQELDVKKYLYEIVAHALSMTEGIDESLYGYLQCSDQGDLLTTDGQFIAVLAE